MRTQYTLLAGVSAVALLSASPAMAGNIVLTGHDNDFHCGGTIGTHCTTLKAEATFVTNGSSLPILSIDNGTELTSDLTANGFAVVAKTVASVTAADFNPSVYSAFAVASVSTCGGCDNPVGTGTTLAAFNTAIASFFNAGGGIFGLTSASDPNGFAYVPEAGGAVSPIFNSSGFVATAAGLAGIPGFLAVNGDETHNIFAGFSSFYQVAETFEATGAAVTIFGTGEIICTGDTCHVGDGVPEPASLALLGAGLFGLGMARRRRKKAKLIA